MINLKIKKSNNCSFYVIIYVVIIMNITYRKSIKKDIQAINNLFIEMITTINTRMIKEGITPYKELEKGYDEGYLDTFYVDDNRVIFVACDNNKVIGYISVVKKDTYLYLDDYCVTEKYRSQGIGSNLIKISEKFAKKNGLNEVHLHVQTANHQSHEFYTRKGYEYIEEEEKRILLGKKLR